MGSLLDPFERIRTETDAQLSEGCASGSGGHCLRPLLFAQTRSSPRRESHSSKMVNFINFGKCFFLLLLSPPGRDTDAKRKEKGKRK